MDKYILLIIICCFFLSCHSQQKKVEPSLKVDIRFYPTGVIEDTRYSILIKNDSIIVKNHFPDENHKVVEYNEMLEKKQLQILSKLIDQITEVRRNLEPTVSDTWGMMLKINGTVFYEDDDFSFDSPPSNIKSIIDYLMSISQVEIDLYGFS